MIPIGQSVQMRGLAMGAVLCAALFAPSFAAAQSAPSDADIIQAIPEPAFVPPSGLEAPAATPAAPAPTPAAATPAPTPAPAAETAPPAQPGPSADEIKKLTGRELLKAPLASLSGPDATIAERLREVIALRDERYLPRKNERDAVEAFYRDRGFKPLWIENGAEAPRAVSAVNYLKGVDADGMEPADYPAPNFKLAEAEQLAEQELKFTAEVLEFVRHAQTGRVHYSRIAKDIEFKLEFPDPVATLTKLAATSNVTDLLASHQPLHEQYRLLKAKLAEARGKNEAGPVRIPTGPMLRFDPRKPMEDARVPLLRERFGLPAVPGDNTYGEALVDAVKEFQKSKQLRPDGILGSGTIAALNGPARERHADIIVANMERWRWMPRDLGSVYVMTNIPDYTLKVVQNGKEVWSTKIVVGKPNLATPITTQEMSFITVNPTWNVPPSIIANEYLPALRQDPDALTRIGLRVTRRRDGSIHVYQPPGDANALGRIRFNFPNRFLVYQHDTPTKHLFKQEKRAYSHGCMRVEDPAKYAEVLLTIARPNETWTAEKIRRMYGQSEQNIQFERKIPVHLAYNTATVEDGKLVIREDIYGRDARVIQTLKGNDRRSLDVAVEHRDPAPRREALRLDRPDYSRPFDFFGLFRSN